MKQGWPENPASGVSLPNPVSSMNVALETHGLTRDFGAFRAVDQLSLRVPAGCFYGFLGPNGAGKSTTIKMLTGLLAPTGGSVRILGEEVSDPRRALAVKRRVGSCRKTWHSSTT